MGEAHSSDTGTPLPVAWFPRMFCMGLMCVVGGTLATPELTDGEGAGFMVRFSDFSLPLKKGWENS